MMARSLVAESRDTLAEEALAAVGEVRIVLARLERSQRNIERLQEARAIERERLVAHIGHCKADLRDAESDLARYDEIDSECEGIHVEIMDCLVDAERQNGEEGVRISTAAKEAGFQFARQELIAKGAPALLERRRRRVEDAGATKSEAEAI